MIEIELSTLFFLCIAVPLCVILVLWISFDWRDKKKTSLSDVQEHLWSCSICGHVYIDSQHYDMSLCPVCGSYLKRDEAITKGSSVS